MDNLQEVSSSAHKNIPIDVLMDYSAKGLSYTDIAKLAGCSRDNVYQRFKATGYDHGRLKAFKDVRTDLLAWKQRELLLSLDDADIKRMQPRDKVVALGILVDKEQLLLGKPTSITGFDNLPDNGLSQAITGLLAKADRIGIRLTDIVGELPSKAKEVLHQTLDAGEHDRLDCSKP
jgi:hypothetical protein